MKPSEIIRAGAAWIREHGWRQDASIGPSGECCLLMSMGLGTLELDVRGLARVHAEQAIRHECGSITLGGWNDTPGRTVEEVLDVMDRAAVALEREGR